MKFESKKLIFRGRRINDDAMASPHVRIASFPPDLVYTSMRKAKISHLLGFEIVPT